MIHILLTAILLKGMSLAREPKSEQLKQAQSLELSRCISFYIMIYLITQTVVKEWQLSIELR